MAKKNSAARKAVVRKASPRRGAPKVEPVPREVRPFDTVGLMAVPVSLASRPLDAVETLSTHTLVDPVLTTRPKSSGGPPSYSETVVTLAPPGGVPVEQIPNDRLGNVFEDRNVPGRKVDYQGHVIMSSEPAAQRSALLSHAHESVPNAEGVLEHFDASGNKL